MQCSRMWLCKERFHGLIYHSKTPQLTMNIFSTGKILITGAKTIESARIAAKKIAILVKKICFSQLRGKKSRKLRKLSPHLTDFKIKNLVISMRLDQEIDMNRFVTENKDDIYYESELFPGVRMKFKNTKTRATIFYNGKIYLTGSADIEEMTNESYFQIINAFIYRKPLVFESDKYGTHRLCICLVFIWIIIDCNFIRIPRY